jgi:heat shock protein HslJ
MLSQFQELSKDSISAKMATLDMKEKEFANAFMGCNHISYNYYNKHKDEIYFKGGLSSAMACEDMRLEDKFNKIMQAISHYHVEGHRLILKSSTGDSMIFVAQYWD